MTIQFPGKTPGKTGTPKRPSDPHRALVVRQCLPDAMRLRDCRIQPYSGIRKMIRDLVDFCGGAPDPLQIECIKGAARIRLRLAELEALRIDKGLGARQGQEAQRLEGSLHRYLVRLGGRHPGLKQKRAATRPRLLHGYKTAGGPGGGGGTDHTTRTRERDPGSAESDGGGSGGEAA